MASRKRRLTVAGLLVGGLAYLAAQLASPVPPGPPPAQPTPTVQPITPQVIQGVLGEDVVVLDGQLEVIVGDVVTDTLQLPRGRHIFVGRLTQRDGSVREFQLTANQALGTPDGPVKLTVPESEFRTESLPEVQSLEAALPAVLLADEDKDATQGTHPYLNVPCVFKGEAAPKPTNFFHEAFMSDQPGSVAWTMKFMSISFEGSETLKNWCQLPEGKAAYLREEPPGSGIFVPNFKKLRDDAVLWAKVANPGVEYGKFEGLNFIVSSLFGCCFWGGRSYVLPAGTAPAGQESRKFNYTISAGSWPNWAAVMPHELAHSLKAKFLNGGGLGHGDDLHGFSGDIWDMMSRPEAACNPSVATQWGCPSQGTSGPQLLLLGAELTQLKYTGAGVAAIDVGYLYETAAANTVYLVVIELQDGTSIIIEARRGGQLTPDRKMPEPCLLARWFNKNGHNLPGRESYRTLLLPWRSDGSDAGDFCGRAGNQLVWGQYAIQAGTPTAVGIPIRVGPKDHPDMKPRLVWLPVLRR